MKKGLVGFCIGLVVGVVVAGGTAYIISKVVIRKEYMKLGLMGKKVKVLVCKEDISAGTRLTVEMLSTREIYEMSSSKRNIRMTRGAVQEIVGRPLRLDLGKGEFILWSDIVDSLGEERRERDRVKKLQLKLAKDQAWGKDNEYYLLKDLEAAARGRYASLSSVLVPKIVYTPYAGDHSGEEHQFHKNFPCYGVIVKIGLPAVPYLVEELSNTDATASEASKMKQTLLAFCIRDVYEQGAMEYTPSSGHGTAMAKSRINVEMEATKDERKRANLKEALAHEVFRTE